ncbi:DmsC/YnfH family molybdoenzyme membrane anchor subunit [Alkalimarinus coralli]|uniref:DmsC/YnfH family molybdoenzyme membrane anchor subunit n=1 Tax=Alkalimarinus coralli TaxID=2935863 RepID=UPI00202B9CDD|nr:DmsC/YnfH family molybdoenzyme membrane anchor subunit [Alkalimarinus coralli]
MIDLLTKARDRLDQMGVDAAPKNTEARPIFPTREEERPYAKLNDPVVSDENRYGVKIDLLDLTNNELPAERPMYINDNPTVGDNPNRNKQHGFHFTADNCIGCHACEAACSEKNGNPAHLAFRSVGYVEGGSYPDYKRLNISMACNHCDNPVCLKGCPTRAYTKHAEYGAVLQDPDTCFGCGYCTWVCPYNAPQLDPIEGQVSKCNMCVDRLEVGLKPACVSACLGNALNFGVIENTPENREQIKTSIPGFPDPSITQPNIRFQQTRTMPNEVQRTDSMPVKYHKQEDGTFRSVVDEKAGRVKSWALDKLSSRENPLVIFTLSTQAVIGAFLMTFLGPLLGIDALSAVKESAAYFPMLISLIVIQAGVLVLSTLHLGKPLRFYRGFNNLRYSPLSREALGIAMFFAGLAGYTFFELLNVWLDLWILDIAAIAAGVFATVSALVGLYFMHCIYRIQARPFWNHWQVLTSFFGTMFSVGGILLGLFVITAMAIQGQDYSAMVSTLGGLVAVGLIAEAIGLAFHARYLNTENGEGAAAHYIQSTTFGKTYLLRNALIGLGVVSSLAVAAFAPAGWFAMTLVLLASLAVVAALLAGRALFYVLVIPTTMPGAFFWKNKGFEQHARDIGLANMPQVGVVPDLH